MSMLKMDQVTVKISGVDILRDISLTVPPNNFVALIGRNGAGKTTLMRSVMNLLPVSRGDIFIAGTNMADFPAYLRARSGVGYLPADRRLVPDWSVEQNIKLPALACNIEDIAARLKRIYALMPEVARFRDRKALQLSGGQQKLVALARALIIGKNLLILDEPFEGVAPALVSRLVEIFTEMKSEKSLSVLISESDAVHSRHLVGRHYTIERGRIVS